MTSYRWQKAAIAITNLSYNNDSDKFTLKNDNYALARKFNRHLVLLLPVFAVHLQVGYTHTHTHTFVVIMDKLKLTGLNLARVFQL